MVVAERAAGVRATVLAKGKGLDQNGVTRSVQRYAPGGGCDRRSSVQRAAPGMAIFAWIDLVTGIALATAELRVERVNRTRVWDDT